MAPIASPLTRKMKEELPPSPSSPFFTFTTPSAYNPVTYYKPLRQTEEDSDPINAGPQLTYAPASGERIYQSGQRDRMTGLSSHHDYPVAHRSHSRLRWLASLAGAMILVMLLCSNRLRDTQNLKLPLDSVKRPLNDLTSSSIASLDLKIPPTQSATRIKLTTSATTNDAVKFMFPIRIGEQETKASSHLLQLGLLARALNRTLVLPRVGEGYLSQCSPLPFETYYAPDALARWGIPVISQANLEASLSHSIGAQHIEFSRQQAPDSLTLSTVPQSEQNLKDTGCFPHALNAHLNISAEGLMLNPPSGWRNSRDSRTAFQRSLVSHFQAQVHISVLLVDWKMLHPIFDPTPSYVQIEYNLELELLANRLVQLLGGPQNVLGVQWRQETIPVPMIERCAELLEKNVGEGSERWLWMASDYPFERFLGLENGDGMDGHTHSGTFHTITRSHHASMAKLVSNLQRHTQRTHKHKLTSLRTLISAHAVDDPVVKKFLKSYGEERGSLGIVEKLVLKRLNRILMGPERVGHDLRCSKGSSYSRQIVKMHQDLGNSIGKTAGRREVGFWA